MKKITLLVAILLAVTALTDSIAQTQRFHNVAIFMKDVYLQDDLVTPLSERVPTGTVARVDGGLFFPQSETITYRGSAIFETNRTIILVYKPEVAAATNSIVIDSAGTIDLRQFLYGTGWVHYRLTPTNPPVSLSAFNAGMDTKSDVTNTATLAMLATKADETNVVAQLAQKADLTNTMTRAGSFSTTANMTHLGFSTNANRHAFLGVVEAATNIVHRGFGPGMFLISGRRGTTQQDLEAGGSIMIRAGHSINGSIWENGQTIIAGADVEFGRGGDVIIRGGFGGAGNTNAINGSVFISNAVVPRISFPQGDYLYGDGTNLFYVTAGATATNALTSN